MTFFDILILLECLIFVFLSHEYFDQWTDGIF